GGLAAFCARDDRRRPVFSLRRHRRGDSRQGTGDDAWLRVTGGGAGHDLDRGGQGVVAGTGSLLPVRGAPPDAEGGRRLGRAERRVPRLHLAGHLDSPVAGARPLGGGNAVALDRARVREDGGGGGGGVFAGGGAREPAGRTLCREGPAGADGLPHANAAGHAGVDAVGVPGDGFPADGGGQRGLGGGGAGDHQHAADGGAGALPRDRHVQGAGGVGQRHPPAVPDRGGPGRAARRGGGAGAGVGGVAGTGAGGGRVRSAAGGGATPWG